MKRYSVAEIADGLGVDVEPVRGFVKTLVALELIEPVGERKSATGFGRCETVYEFTDGFEITLLRILARLCSE